MLTLINTGVPASYASSTYSAAYLIVRNGFSKVPLSSSSTPFVATNTLSASSVIFLQNTSRSDDTDNICSASPIGNLVSPKLLSSNTVLPSSNLSLAESINLLGPNVSKSPFCSSAAGCPACRSMSQYS